MSASLIDGARQWLLDAVKTQYPKFGRKKQVQWFLIQLLFHEEDCLAPVEVSVTGE